MPSELPCNRRDFELMHRGSSKFTQSDVARALKGAHAAGFDPDAVEITTQGVIRLSRGSQAVAAKSPLDAWKAKYDARKAERN